MTDEMEAAREEYLNSNESVFDAFGSGWRRGRASLEEENRRLREALRKIQAGDGEHYCDCEHDTPECCVNVDYFCPHCIAGAALAGKSGEVGNGAPSRS